MPELVKFGSEQAEAVAALPSSLALLNRSLTTFAQTVARLDTLVKRIDRLEPKAPTKPASCATKGAEERRSW